MAKKEFKTYIMKYVESIPLDDIAQMKEKVQTLPNDCDLYTYGNGNKAIYLCRDYIAAYNDEGAIASVKANYPHLVALNEFRLFDLDGRRIKLG